MPHLEAEFLETAVADVLKMVQSKDDVNRIRACKTLPSLVKHAAARDKILNEETFQRVLDLGGVSETESLMVQMHAAQTLSLLARYGSSSSLETISLDDQDIFRRVSTSFDGKGGE